MILVTGSTGFIGRSLMRQLEKRGEKVRVLLQPSSRTPNLPRGLPVEVTVASLTDTRGLQAAMQDVETIYHLAGEEGGGSRANLLSTDILGTRTLAETAAQQGIARFFYISHLGANTASAFPVLRAKGQAEQAIIDSGVPYTILRAAIIFGAGDQFSTGLAKLMAAAPGIMPIPAQGEVYLQPLWVEDLTTCMTWALDDENTRNQIYEIGGAEYLSLKQILLILQETIGIKRRLQPVSPQLLRGLTTLLENSLPGFPFSSFWLDYLATDRIGPADTLPRVFHLLPEPFHQRLEHLKGVNWYKEAARMFLRK